MIDVVRLIESLMNHIYNAGALIAAISTAAEVFNRLFKVWQSASTTKHNHNTMMTVTIILPLLLLVSTVSSQSYTFPLGPNQPYPQYNSELSNENILLKSKFSDMYESRYPYIPSQQIPQGGSGMSQMSQMGQMNQLQPGLQMNQIPNFSPRFNQIPMHNQPQNLIQQRFQFNPMARIHVQPPIQDSSFPSSFPSSSPRITSPVSTSEYQVDQRIPLPKASSESLSSAVPTRIIPPFLESASVAEQDKFYEIVQHPTWSGVEKNRRIEEFMKTMSDERQSMYTNFRRDVVDKELEEKRRNVDRAVSSMTKEAADEFQRVVRIMHDPSRTESEKLKKIEEIYSKLPDAIRKEFDVKLKGFR
ncbi:Protein CBG02982 [Caenorhabditis briggsae]|uniref:Protein CBG02982 n=1 Tax=Caenorhabditis briggsae TaxID=6238 RepID=A8WT22_CAEBR|nr:Protein CBG02982 [Caenorhabditis briggsae]CAP23633.2 Protein CBG02982 [Caenorhabditis briggsae]